MKRAAIVQSNYIPWKGYFDLISAVDEFILLDDVQYTRRDWRNRNLIKTPQGLTWLTVPVKVKGMYHQTVRETQIDGTSWARKHWQSLSHHYRSALHFDDVASLLEPLYLSQSHEYLSQLNRCFIEAICNYMGIKTRITTSSDYELLEGKTDRLAHLCTQVGATEYVSGPAAKDYMEPGVFDDKGIKLTWFEYQGYPEYRQLWGDFSHGVSIVDLLFNCGPESSQYLRRVGT